ncbi:hypothetical protein LguiB_026934 [Lonicera macranthoides]
MDVGYAKKVCHLHNSNSTAGASCNNNGCSNNKSKKEVSLLSRVINQTGGGQADVLVSNALKLSQCINQKQNRKGKDYNLQVDEWLKMHMLWCALVVYPCMSGQPWFTLNERKRFGGTGGLKSESKETQTLFLIIGRALVPHCPSLSTLKREDPLRWSNDVVDTSGTTTMILDPQSTPPAQCSTAIITPAALHQIVNPHTVDADGELYTVKNILISVGGWPSIPSIP